MNRELPISRFKASKTIESYSLTIRKLDSFRYCVFSLIPGQAAQHWHAVSNYETFFVPFAREMYDQGYKTTMEMEIGDRFSFLLSRNFLRTVSNDAITPFPLSSTAICPLGAQPLKNSSALEISSPFLFSTLCHSSTKGVRVIDDKAWKEYSKNYHESRITGFLKMSGFFSKILRS